MTSTAQALPSTPRPAVFLDRDGTVIEDRHYLADPAGVVLLPGAARAIARLNRAGIPVILVTNQSGIGRGYYDEADFQAVQHRVEMLLGAEGARLDAVYHCPHAPDADPPCPCRKPGTGLFRRAAREHSIDLARSIFIGDRLRDVLPGLEFGGSGFLVGPFSGEGNLPAAVAAAQSLEAAVDGLLASRALD